MPRPADLFIPGGRDGSSPFHAPPHFDSTMPLLPVVVDKWVSFFNFSILKRSIHNLRLPATVMLRVMMLMVLSAALDSLAFAVVLTISFKVGKADITIFVVVQ